MPFLRVIRDKRGYETTYLMHWYREGSRQRSRILWVFRTPAGVRVGKESLEPATLREIEASNPGIDFDWKSVFDNRQVVEPSELRRPRKRRRPDESSAEPAEPPQRAQSAPAAPANQPRVPIPSAIEGATADEQTAFLSRWYPIIRERIPQRTSDPARREALLALAERLNPAAWSDADQIAAGLQAARDALERLSRVFAGRRRRQRRPKSSDSGASPENSHPSPAEPPTLRE